LPEKDPVYDDLHFFEQHFKGVLPFEIAIDTRQRNGLFANNARALYKIKKLQSTLDDYPHFSKPISIVEAVKFSYQAYRGGEGRFYSMPGVTDLKELQYYTGSVGGQNDRLSSFIDTSRQITRIS